MKFVISFLFFASAYASPIQVYFESDSTQAKMLKDILITDYQIPEELITMKKIKECEGIKTSGKLELCLKNNGDLLVVSVDRHFINESLKVFQAP